MKTCVICKKTFTKPPKQRLDWWETAKYCGQDCYKKRIVSQETRDKMREHMKGNKHGLGHSPSLEHRRKISLVHTGNKHCLGKKLTDEHKRKIGESQKGEKNYNWIADRSKLKTDRRHAYDSQYKNWMKQVKNRDYWRCKTANGSCSGRVEAHHILTWREYPELRYEVNNGITLCHFHHPRRKEDEKRLQSDFQALVSVSNVHFGHCK